MLIETAFSLLQRVCGLKYLWHRAAPYLETHLAYAAALFNALIALERQLHPTAPPHGPRIAHFAL